MPPQGMTALDLPQLIKQYLDLSPDIFAERNYFEVADENGWLSASAGWDWLRDRLKQDSTPLQNIAEWNSAAGWEEGI